MEKTKDNPSVLVVNDDHEARHATVKALNPYFNITEAATGAEGMAKALAGPDLILLDVNPPDMSGFDVCNAIKKDPATAHLPVLHLSASSPDAASRADGLENGSDGFLPLPVETSVLVVDDEEIVRKTVNRMLTALGYECTCAADGAAALGLYKAALGTPGAFKAVIMDLTLPGGMDGTETVKRLLELNPQAKVVVSSGYSEDDVPGGYQAAGFSAALMKPYKYEDLAAVIAKLLDSPTC